MISWKKFLLDRHLNTDLLAGQFELWEETQGMTFTLLKEDTWQEELNMAGIA